LALKADLPGGATHMAAPSLHLFGPPALETAAGREPFVAARPHQLLAYLACRGAWVTRDVAATLLWPERDTSTARANLRFVLVQIRRLSYIDGLETRADSLRWAVDTDVHRFERAVTAADSASALAVYDGSLLEGFELGAPAPFVEWLQFERARLHALWRDAVAARLAQLVDDPASCVALAGRALQTDPLDETALGFQLRALAALGRSDEARRAYRDYAQRLATELGIEPSADLRDFARQFDPQRQSASSSAATGAGAARSSTVLVGRRVELARLRQLLLADDCRLLTINGPGGVGKSVLARAAIPELASQFTDGAFWIALDDLQALEQIAPRSAVTLGFELSGAEAPQRQLIGLLRNSRTLLVFDNAEHLAGFPAWLDALLAACDGVKVLVTSRARLDLACEWVLPLQGLPVPDADETETDALRAYDSVRLFELRAARAHPDFDARAHAAEVATLVRAVDGLPLAIELAAAWVRLLPVSEIHRELSRSLDLLDDAHTASGRTHSMRASLEHSWRLLVPAEQRGLAQLAVFQGDFSRESALAVAEAVLPLLAALADKSLLRTTEQGRFAFHPLIQQFALEKLVQSGPDQERAARTHHAEHFLALLARYNAFESVDQREALRVIGTEIQNVLAAWAWAVAQRRVDLLQRCATALEGYFDAGGEQQSGLAQFDLAATAIDDSRQDHQHARCEIQVARAAFCFWRGEYRAGEAAARAALQAAHRARYRFGIKTSTNTLGLMLWRLGRMKEGAFCLRDVLRRARADEDQVAVPLYAGNLGVLERELGNYAEAERLLTEALDGHRRVGHHVGLQSTLNELCVLHMYRGQPAAVLPLARESLLLAESSGVRHSVPYSHRNLAGAYFELNDLAAAEKHARLALEASRFSGDRSIEPSCYVQLANIALRAGNVGAALSELQAAGRLAQEMQSPRVKLTVATVYARWCRHQSLTERARMLLSLVVAHPTASRQQRERAATDLAALPAGSADADPADAARRVSDLDQALDFLSTERV
jgi:DNA-binding SARP family transcriptional activator/tetratricopeptide (TPR) repeat protein